MWVVAATGLARVPDRTLARLRADTTFAPSYRAATPEGRVPKRMVF
jgi:hypothetical protein